MMKDTVFCERYLEQINGPFAGINLTRINTAEEFFDKQYVDSVKPIEDIPSLKKIYDQTKIHVDIGFGGGFPLLPLASLNPDKKYIGFEARGKKSKVVNQIAEAIGLDNVKTYHQRFEHVYFDRDCTITFKAVSTIQNLLPLIVTDKTVNVIFYKGPNFYELEDLDWLGNKWEIVEETLIDIPNTEGRMMIALRNKNVLRGTEITSFRKNKNKQLVTLSSFL
ncbi:16S rRNA (guanine(527)-N(7))-methyltransferase RsmG [Halobacteriovorax sp. RT-2-6]|uniref:16S rRNA (guanine(527)-N(7))-methyltransferase RsmG n=1 Tax=unclassified Halobacteriovorax TaxID=2639665 RepID=UPI00399B2088